MVSPPNLYNRVSSDEFTLMQTFTETLAISQSSNLSVPYFRYFGPSAIVPGFKQTVVKLKEHRHSPRISLPIPSGFSHSIYMF